MSYILDESLNLLEAFSDSMPMWMRQRLRNDSGSRRYKSNDLKPSGYSSKADYKSRDLFQLLNNAGYDLSKMEVVEAPKPESMNDPIFDDYDKLPVLHVVTANDDQIYIPGINDNLRYINDTGNESSFKYFNNSNYKKYVKDFAYIDLSAANTHKPDDVINRNTNAFRDFSGKKEIRPGTESGQRLNKDQMNYNWQKSKYDKSGYYRGNDLINSDLKSRLSQFKKDRLPRRYLELEKIILDLRDDLIEKDRNRMADSSSMKELKQINYESQLDKQLLQNIITEYVKYQDYMNPDGSFPYFINNFGNVENNIKRLQQSVSGYKLANFIW